MWERGISKPRGTKNYDYFADFQQNNGVLMQKNSIF